MIVPGGTDWIASFRKPYVTKSSSDTGAMPFTAPVKVAPVSAAYFLSSCARMFPTSVFPMAGVSSLFETVVPAFTSAASARIALARRAKVKVPSVSLLALMLPSASFSGTYFGMASRSCVSVSRDGTISAASMTAMISSMIMCAQAAPGTVGGSDVCAFPSVG